MKPHILFIFVYVFMQITVSSQTSDVGYNELALSSENEGLSKVSELPKAGYLQGALEVIPFESAEDCDIKVSAFPNPIKQNITLLTFGNNGRVLHYELKDNTKTLASKKIVRAKESIEVNSLDGDIYILTVSLPDKKLKSFKIIKH